MMQKQETRELGQHRQKESLSTHQNIHILNSINYI